MEEAKVYLSEAQLLRLQEQIDNGQYVVNASEIADALIDDVLCAIDPVLVESIFE